MKIFTVLFLLLSSVIAGVCEEQMTPALFREIVSKPGDNLPLPPKFYAVPLWTNAIVDNVMKYEGGKVFEEEMKGMAKTVGGKYVVFSLNSKFYQQTISGIAAWDEKTSAFKLYGLYGDGQGGSVITVATAVYDFEKKTYTVKSTYGDFREETHGSYTDTNSVEKTVVYKSGKLVMTREVKTRPVAN